MTDKDEYVPEHVKELVNSIDGKIESSGVLPDGSGFCTASFPLPEDHWLLAEGINEPPAPMRMGCDDPERKIWEERLMAAGRYAVRASTMNGKDDDFDPDAMVRNMIIGMLGYYTPDGYSHI